MDWLDLLAVQGTLKSLLQHHSSKASILWCSAFLIVQLSHPYMTTGRTIALTRRTFVGKVMSLLLNMLSGLVITGVIFYTCYPLLTPYVPGIENTSPGQQAKQRHEVWVCLGPGRGTVSLVTSFFSAARSLSSPPMTFI